MSKLKKRTDGRYQALIYLGRDERNKKIYKSVYATSPSELKDKEAQVRAELGKGLDILSQRDLFTTWADDWLRGKCAAKITDGQKENYRHAVSVWKEKFNNYEIGQVRTDDIERILIQMQEENYSERTIKFYKSTISQVFRRAVGRVISANPVDGVLLTSSGRAEEKRRALTAEEQKWIFDTPHRGQPIAIIMMLSGLRRGELAALTWNDINIPLRTISVSKTIEYPPNKPPKIRQFAKTDTSIRTIDIPKKLAEYLSNMEHDNILVIHTVKGGVMTVQAWNWVWSSYMNCLNKKYGTRTLADYEKMKKSGQHKFDMTIPHFTMHWLRHTFCTLMYLSGVDVVQAAAQMGHADVTTTLNIYTHLDAIHKRKSVDKLDEYLSSNL